MIRSERWLLGNMDKMGNSAGADDRGDLDRLQREAIGWVVRLTSGDATTEDAEQLKAWRARSRDHEEAFRLASQIWRETGRGALGADFGVRGRKPVLSRRLFLAGAGSGAALAAGWAGVSLGVLPGPAQLLSDYSTAVGRQSLIDLPDGTRVDLDGASALDARFTADERTARLVTGAAAFDVRADARHFHVAAGPGMVTAHDAAFAISTGAGPTRVECTRGSIMVEDGGDVRLKAGERVVLDAGHLSAPEAMDPANAAPWRRGLLIFENRPFEEVVADINRHRRGRVVLARPGLGARRVDGVFHLDRPDEIVANLAASLRLRETRLPGGIVLLT